MCVRPHQTLLLSDLCAVELRPGITSLQAFYSCCSMLFNRKIKHDQTQNPKIMLFFLTCVHVLTKTSILHFFFQFICRTTSPVWKHLQLIPLHAGYLLLKRTLFHPSTVTIQLLKHPLIKAIHTKLFLPLTWSCRRWISAEKDCCIITDGKLIPAKWHTLQLFYFFTQHQLKCFYCAVCYATQFLFIFQTFL